MSAEEENFPRGGVRKKPTDTAKFKSRKNADRDLFKVHSDTRVPKKRKSSQKAEEKQNPKKQKLGTEASFTPNSGQIELLTHKMICSGMLTLAVVKEVRDYELVVSLPNNLTGTVAITAISDTYTELLQKVADQSLDTDEDVHSLDDLFQVGQIVRCKVMDVKQISKGNTSIKLSIKPSDVNVNVTASSLKTGQVLCGTVVSQEDHGYVIDLGVKGVKTFLSNDDAEKFIQVCNDGFSLKLAQYLHCYVQTTDHIGMLAGESRSVHVTIDPSKVMTSKVTPNMKLSFFFLVPGMVVTAQIEKVTQNGLVVGFLSYKAAIHSTHLPKKPKEYEVQQKIQACVLFIHPTTKLVSLSYLPHLLNNPSKPCSLFTGVQYGDFVERAKITWVESSRGLGFQLTETLKGFCMLRNVSDKKVISLKNQFSPGDTHRCRVIGFNYLEAVVLVSLRESHLTRQFMKLTDIQLGSVVECQVRAIHDSGMSVKLDKWTKGFISSLHLADVPLKHPEKKFKEGDKLKCRVLQIDLAKAKLFLTNKRSLVNSKLPVISSYDQMEPGMEAEGFIANIKDRGVLVVFYNKIKGWVHKDELSTERVPDPGKVFYLGQVVRCRVLSVQPSQQRAQLSFKLGGAGLVSKQQKSTPAPEDFKIGKIVDCKVVRKKDSGLDVTVLSSDTPAYLPKPHLSDSRENCQQLMKLYQVGDVIKEVMYLTHTSHTLVTHKFSHIQASRDGSLVSQFSEIQPGLLLPGTIKNIMEYGVFVEFPGGMFGLAPNKFICDRRLSDISAEFPVGTSVSAKVVEVDQEKSRFLVSLRLADCYHGNNENMLEVMSTVLMEREEIRAGLQKKRKDRALKQLSSLADLTVGKLVPVTITNQNRSVVSCDLGNEIRGMCNKDLIEGQTLENGRQHEAVVLCVNLAELSVDLSLNEEHIRAAKHRKENRFTKVKEGQIIKGEIILVKPDFAVVGLRGHALGGYAYLPVRKHLNDVLEKVKFSVGEVKSVFIKSVENGLVIGNWLEYVESGETTGEGHVYDIRKPGLQLGTIAKALVKAVHDLQMNVIVRNSPGRVHITQVPDNTVVGSFPMKKYKDFVGQRISVKVVGFREVKTHKFLPFSHANAIKSIPECSLLPSVLEKKGLRPGEEIKAKKFKVGDTVTAYVDHFSGQYLWFVVTHTVRGRAHVLHLSTDAKVVDERTERYQPGQVCQATVLQVMDRGELELSLIGVPEVIRAGCLTLGLVIGRTHNETALNLHLWGNYIGRVWLTDVMDKYRDNPLKGFRDGQCVRCRVLSCDLQTSDSEGRHLCSLSLRPSRCRADAKKKVVVDPDVQNLRDLKEGQILRGFVIKHSSSGIIVCLGHGITGLAIFENISEYFIKDPQVAYPPGKVVTVKILSINRDTEKLQLSFLKRDTGVAEDVPSEVLGTKRDKTKKMSKTPEEEVSDSVKVKRKSYGEEEGSRKKRLKTSDSDDTSKTLHKVSGVKDEGKSSDEDDTDDESDSGVDFGDEQVATVQPDKPLPRLQVSEDFNWDVDYSTIAPPTRQDEISSDSEEETVEQKSSRKSKKAVLKEQKVEEKRLFELEKEQKSGAQQPQTADDFDRMVLESPDSSLVWLRYVAYHLEMTEIEKARAVLERALQTINFREEQEKLNIWVGYLNLENMYGTEESLNSVLTQALRQNDQLSVYSQLINIYVKSAKIEEGEKLYQTIVKKFSGNKEVWVKFGLFYFKHDNTEAGRKLLQRCLKSLPKQEHLEVISKFAQLEFKFGEAERGKTMFENILSNYPKRTDLWSVYIDMVTKLDEVDMARQLFERVINLKLSVKKMKFFFKKYLDFEKSYGTEESMLSVKQKALEYVESRGSLDELEN
ncbi:protein RRP5 homolog [Liolophura sinensis]|uniref:protein RRP5 homolog n=1 Tax=Liolophura sinensis TaxID=3198878 RepID=UPI003159016C